MRIHQTAGSEGSRVAGKTPEQFTEEAFGELLDAIAQRKQQIEAFAAARKPESLEGTKEDHNGG
jgi:hypothetical protein